jgi:hypothetical protein
MALSVQSDDAHVRHPAARIGLADQRRLEQCRPAGRPDWGDARSEPGRPAATPGCPRAARRVSCGHPRRVVRPSRERHADGFRPPDRASRRCPVAAPRRRRNARGRRGAAAHAPTGRRARGGARWLPGVRVCRRGGGQAPRRGAQPMGADRCRDDTRGGARAAPGNELGDGLPGTGALRRHIVDSVVAAGRRHQPRRDRRRRNYRRPPTAAPRRATPSIANNAISPTIPSRPSTNDPSMGVIGTTT